MKTATALLALSLMVSAASATVPHVNGSVSGIVREHQLAAAAAQRAAAAQAQANATGQPAFANGGVYLPQTPTPAP